MAPCALACMQVYALIMVNALLNDPATKLLALSDAGWR